MELRTTQRLRRNEQLAKSEAKKADAGTASAKAPATPRQAPADKLTLSKQALNFLEAQNRKMWEQDMEREQRRQAHISDSLSALDDKKKALDDLDKKLKVLSKCQKIAASIMKGDHVPPEDLRYLMENDPAGYKLAMAMRREKEDPEDVESVLDEEDKHGETSEASGSGGETPAVSASEASSCGGNTSAAE